MGRITVLHTADLHLGSSFRGVPAHIGRQRRKDLMQTLARMAELCRQNQTDLFLISGDLWDEHYITRPLVDYIADQFRRIPGTRVLIAPGRADFNHQNSFYREYPWPDNVHVFYQQELSSIWLPHLNTRVYGMAWTGPESPSCPNWEQVAENHSTGCQILIIAYGNPDTVKIPEKVLGMENLAYVALGGAHRHTAWSAKVLDPGCPEPLGFSCHGPFGVLQGAVGSALGSLEFIPLGSRQFYTLQVNADNSATMEDVAADIKQRIASMDPGKNLFKIELTGTRPGGHWDLEAIRARLDDIFCLSIADKTETRFNIDTLAAEHSKGVVGRYIAAVKDVPSGDEDVRKKALAIGLDALLSGRVAPW